VHGPAYALRQARHRPARDVEPDLPVGVHAAGREHAAHEFLARERFSRAAGILRHVGRAEAAAPQKRVVVVQAEVVLHPENVRAEGGVARVELYKIVLPGLVHGAYAERGLAPGGVHHAAERLVRAERLAEIGVHEAVPRIDGHRDVLRRDGVAHVLQKAQIDLLLFRCRVAGVDLLHVAENRHVVDFGLAAEALQGFQLARLVKIRVAAEAKGIAKGILHKTSRSAGDGQAVEREHRHAHAVAGCAGTGIHAPDAVQTRAASQRAGKVQHKGFGFALVARTFLKPALVLGLERQQPGLHVEGVEPVVDA